MRYNIKDNQLLINHLNALAGTNTYSYPLSNTSVCLVDNTNTVILYGKTKSDLHRQLTAFIDGYKTAQATINK